MKLASKLGSMAFALAAFFLSFATMLIVERETVRVLMPPEADPTGYVPSFQAGNGIAFLGILLVSIPIEFGISLWLAAIVHKKASKRLAGNL